MDKPSFYTDIEDVLIFVVALLTFVGVSIILEGCSSTYGIEKTSNCSAKFEYKCSCDAEKDNILDMTKGKVIR